MTATILKLPGAVEADADPPSLNLSRKEVIDASGGYVRPAEQLNARARVRARLPPQRRWPGDPRARALRRRGARAVRPAGTGQRSRRARAAAAEPRRLQGESSGRRARKMPAMGRRRKVDEGLEPRVYRSHGAFFYAHPGKGWERLGTDKDAGERQGAHLQRPRGPARHPVLLARYVPGRLRAARRAEKSTVKGVKLSQRTLDDYREAFGTREDPGPVREYWAPPRTPLDVTPDSVQQFLRDEAEAGRPVQGNRRRAALSACIGWLLREGSCPA
jgi:hypothetical protein